MKARPLVLFVALAAAMLCGCKPIQRMLNHLPTASVAVPLQTVSLATLTGPVTLSGTGHDSDGDSLSYLWYYYDAPTGSAADLYDYNTATAYFTPTPAVTGDYIFLFQVNDGLEDSKPVKVTVTVTL